ncbi:MAG: hypothetical protein WC984_01195 [Bacteroidales bacterium]
MKRLILIIVISFISLNLFATAQESDYLIYKGDTLKLLTNPLDSYFQAHNVKFDDFFLSEEFSISSSRWRGYIAYFEIKNNKLYVVDILKDYSFIDSKGNDYSEDISVMDSVFPKQDKYLLKEYTGVLRIPIGKMKNYVHMGYSSGYEGYNFIEIEKGEVLAEKYLSNEEYRLIKETQYKEYMKTEEYENELNEMIKNSTSENPRTDLYIHILYNFFEPKINVREAQLDFGGLSE